ncbi:SpvB/TcaC N-terminal domain-containing protein [Nonomuraea sp. NPDC051941]|uniref:SpvB/TcaC N-terminal domain-containing protein n=1 Tax=Nonomuraea sp. NPDC051941 TaxID=3364373 RepID=UPI0037CCABAA
MWLLLRRVGEEMDDGEPAQSTRAHTRASPAATAAAASDAGDSGIADGALPGIALPKGGGAIRGEEKFSTNAAAGTGTLALTLPASPGRAGFSLDLRLSYDSGAGNGPFGLGWQLSTPAITRKTAKGLPRYEDAVESDTFILSGAEDLVVGGPVQRRGDFHVHRFRPRVEGGFARIERWTHRTSGDVHWRSLSGDNVLNIYGRSDAARIADPGDRRRVFSWLLEETRDDRGNAARYEYRSEDPAAIDETLASEASRFEWHADGSCTFLATAQRYLKRIQYGNAVPVLDREAPLPDADAAWHFEVVFDYGEHDPANPTPRDDERVGATPWSVRADPFSTYRSGFEVRSYRLCHRVLMFHRFAELGADCLIRSLDLTYDETPSVTYLSAATQVGHRRVADPVTCGTTYARASWPSLELTYSRAVVHDRLHVLDAGSRAGLDGGVETTGAQWIDLDGEGLPGVLILTAGAWYYKANLGDATFAPPVVQGRLPVPAVLGPGRHLVDIDGDGVVDLVANAPPIAGFFARVPQSGWAPFVPFTKVPRVDWEDPNLRLIDLDSDGYPDLLITQHDAFVWYRSSGREGFEPASILGKATDEQRGPAIVFADGTESIQLADMSGDGLADLVRVRYSEVCYWPNLGHGRFGSKVTLDNCPVFDSPDQFDPLRARFADIDGSGTSDLAYLGRDGVRLYFNQAGNRLSDTTSIMSMPVVDSAARLSVIDLLGAGTACLVLSSASPASPQPVAYVDLMGGTKPHLLIGFDNNLGTETRIEYRPSTRFYLADKAAGRPWLTRLPFPVHVITRVDTIDHVSRSRFVCRYAYHDGYFDPDEREFRGFGMVEQWDAEEFGTLTGYDPANDDAAVSASVPPIHTKTWFHTGLYFGHQGISTHYAADYFHEPGLSAAEADAMLLDDTVIPFSLSFVEEREACRALRGSRLRSEVYADDHSARAALPYTVVEQNFTIQCLQRRGSNRHGVFMVHPRESITYNYERDPADPRTTHVLTIEVDAFGNARRSVSVGYGRRAPDASLPLEIDRTAQARTYVTCTEHDLTTPIDTDLNYRLPLPASTRVYELTGYAATGPASRFVLGDFPAGDPVAPARRRLFDHQRVLYRRDDLTALLPLGTSHSRAHAGERFQLSFTSPMLSAVLSRTRDGHPAEDLLTAPAEALAADGFRVSQDLKAAGLFPATDADDEWWAPSGLTFLSREPSHTAVEELAYAREHFFLPVRLRDPFHTATAPTERILTYDAYDLLPVATRDPVGNEQLATNDYRVLAPHRVRDINGNVREVAFDMRGMVTGTAVMGKSGGPVVGDSLTGFQADLEEAVALAHIADPLVDPLAILGRATTRVVYDLFAYTRTRTTASPSPIAVYTLARRLHHSATGGAATATQHAFVYYDGLGRDIQMKTQAEGGRWVGSGRTVYNNKGKAVRSYEPFFSATQAFEFASAAGVSAVVFYDPADRAVATLMPNHTYHKVLFGPWSQETWDANDTVLDDPRTDPHITPYAAAYTATLDSGWQTWFDERVSGGRETSEQAAAQRTREHARTPTRAYFDVFGRQILTIAHNGWDASGTPRLITARVSYDIQGNRVAVRDAVPATGYPAGRLVATYTYDLRSLPIRQQSMESGSRWQLCDALGKPSRSWDDRGHAFRTERDPLRRPVRSFVSGLSAGQELLVERLIYGEQHPDPSLNLRGRIYLHLDQAGALADDGHDFKGNQLGDTRRLARAYDREVSWTAVDNQVPATATTALDLAALEAALAPLLEPERYSSRAAFNALDRVVQLVPPHGDRPDALIDVVQPAYNAANLLERIDVWVGVAAVPAALLDPVALPPANVGIDDIEYDAKGQRTLVAYRNGVTKTCSYDPLTFLPRRIYTRRGTAFADDCQNPQPPPDATAAPGDPPPNAPCGLQNLQYTYDPMGNVVRVTDLAQHTIFFRNRRVDASRDYTYDPLYRLVEATGREHLGQNVGVPVSHSYNDVPRIGLAHPNDGNALGRYVESFEHDDVGNITSIRHAGLDPAQPGWTRTFTYAEASRLEPAEQSNRLTSSAVGGTTEVFSAGGAGYDAHGNMLRMQHLAVMRWDFRDQLQMIQRQAVAPDDTDGTLHNGERTFYVYDASGRRVRKVTQSPAGAVREERVYLGSAELYRRYGSVVLTRETLHITDGHERVALVETRTAGNEPGVPATRITYQHSEHTGSTALTLSAAAEVAGYEEYSPYGATTYQARDPQLEEPRRYRHAGRERDVESGLYYYGARYYAPWLARWCSADRTGIEGGMSLYVYAHGNPITFDDPDGSEPEPRIRLTTWLLTGGNKWQETKENLEWVTADMRRGDTWFNSAAGYGALVGIVGAFENTFYLGYDIGRAAFWNELQDNSFADMVNAFRQEGIAAIPKGIAAQAERAMQGDAPAFGELLFSSYMAAESAGNIKITPKTISVSVPIVVGERLALATVGVTAPVVEGAVPLAASVVLMSKAGGGGGKTPTERWEVRRHGDQPKPRPIDHESHHGVMSSWMRRHFKKFYNANDAPTVLMPEEAHNITRGVFNRWMAQIEAKTGAPLDWGKITESQMRALAEQMFKESKTPVSIQRQYWQAFDKYLQELKKVSGKR